MLSIAMDGMRSFIYAQLAAGNHICLSSFYASAAVCSKCHLGRIHTDYTHAILTWECERLVKCHGHTPTNLGSACTHAVYCASFVDTSVLACESDWYFSPDPLHAKVPGTCGERGGETSKLKVSACGERARDREN